MKLPRRLLPLLPALALAATLAACAGTAAQPDPSPVTLAPHQSAQLSPGAKVTFESVSDSRCPPDVKCIWAGKLSYQFTLHSGATAESFSLGPDQVEYTSPALHGARIALDTKAIPPVRAAQAAPMTPSVTLKLIGQ